MWEFITYFARNVLNKLNREIFEHLSDEQICNMICAQLVDCELVKANEIDDDLCEAVISNMTLSDFVDLVFNVGIALHDNR